MTHFRQQVTEYDCVPTCFLNAYTRLFERKDIPPAVIQKTYALCLDAERGSSCVGTTRAGIQHLADWLSGQSRGRFAVEAQFLAGEDVSLQAISRHLRQEGVALLRVKHDRRLWHYVLALQISGDWIECHDPYAKATRANNSGNYEFTKSEPQGPNLRIHMDWLETRSNEKPFRLGTKEQRECVLLTRRS